ncbi:MAG: tadC [Solirubrobacterales bacterium]|jgi:tight adherence protein C|nr:tadC [Solirubrobacterales bacterium]
MTMLAIVSVLLVGAAIVLAARAVALPRIDAVRRLREIASYGFAGDGMVPEIDQEPDPLRPLERWAQGLGAPLARRLQGRKAEELTRQLRAAGLYTTPIDVVLGYRVLFAGSVVAVLALLLATSALAVPIKVLIAVYCLVLAWYLPLVLLRRRGRLRLAEVDRQLPDLIELLVVTLEAGLGFSSSLRMATSRITGALGDELRLAVQEQDLGVDVRDSLHNMLTRADSPAMRSFVRGIDQGQSMGVSIGTIMRNLAREMRKRRRASVEERAQKAPVKMLFPLVFLIFPALFLVLGYPVVRSLSHAFGG